MELSSPLSMAMEQIDLAERFLLSSQFDEASALSSSVLLELMRPGILQDSEPDAIHDMIESAGMVLIQAYSETGRSSKIFEVLEPIFGCVAEVPLSIFLAGVCLQMSAGLFSDARMAIESFLQDWTSTPMREESCVLKLTGKRNHEPVYLKLETYMEVVEIYCIQVLAKGLKNVDLAQKWVTEADISADKKQGIREKLEKISSIPETKDGAVSISQYKVSETKFSNFYSDTATTSLLSETGKQIDEVGMQKRTRKEADSQVLSRSIHLFFPVVGFLSRLMHSSSVDYPLYASRWHKVLAVVSQRKAILGGAASFFLLCAIYKQRHNLTRLFRSLNTLLRDLLHTIRVGFVDFWQLAFNVQLNPLAAVQPLPASHHIRRRNL